MNILNDCFRASDTPVCLSDAVDLFSSRLTCNQRIERISIKNTTNRVLAENLFAQHDIQPQDNSAVDGYAVYFDDLNTECETCLPIVDRVAAGHPIKRQIERGSAVQIFTGAPLPKNRNLMGPDTIFMKEDVQTLSPMIKVAKGVENNSDNSQIENEDGHEERVKMSRLRQTISSRLKEAQNTAAILTTYNEVDMSEIKKIRTDYKDLFIQKHGISLGFMSFFVKACSHALLEIPEVNAEINNDEIIYKNYVNMGVAVGTPNGLVVPVVKNTHKLSFAEIEKEISRLGKKGNDGKLTMDEMQGGTFTISNGGVYGSLMSAPILHPPQSGIFGMHKIQDRPIVVEGAIVARPMMYIALSYDHRLIDGKGAVTFLVRVKEALEDPRRLLMGL